MTRRFAGAAALLSTALTLSSAGLASAGLPLRFTIEPSGNPNAVQVNFKRGERPNVNHWTDNFPLPELAGLDGAALRAPGTRPIRFAIVREAGRVDCAGTGGNAMAIGTCTMTPDAGFDAFLAARGIAVPNEEQSFNLVALDVHRDLVTALASAGYPTPTTEKLVELTAVHATPALIHGLAERGYRPRSLNELVEFAALKITPDYVASFERAGYTDLRAHDLVQLRALGITPAFIAGFERIGYGRLPVSTLIQLKALDVTPDFVRAVQQGSTLPSPDRLVELRALGREMRKH